MNIAIADTHAVIWYLGGDANLSSSARGQIEKAIDTGNSIGVSSISLVEMIYLIDKGTVPRERYSSLARSLRDGSSPFRVIPVTTRIADSLRQIPRDVVPDMPDRIIASTALLYSLPLITRDEKIRASKVRTIW